MIVVDTNVLVYLLLPGETTALAARAVLRRDPVWAAPLLWRSEFRNALTVYLRQGHITLDHALSVHSAAEQLLTGGEHPVDGEVVLRLAAQSGRSAYDCEFVALAQALGVPLVTSDREVLASFPDVAVALATFGA